MRFTAPAALLFAASLATACGGPLEEDAAAPVGEESLASQEQRADEACVSSSVVFAQPDGARVSSVFPHCSWADQAATSVDGSYDQTSCPHRFVTEVINLNNVYAQPFVEAIPATTNVTESACKSIAIVGSAFGYKNGGWYNLGSITTAGVWHPAGTGPISFPASCQLRFNIGAGASGYSKVRVTGLAAVFAAFPGRVRTGVNIGNGPC